MKKTLVIMLALFLAIPAISYAGSATSRWDLTIGGDVKFDTGWSDQAGVFGNDLWTPGVPMRNAQSGTAGVPWDRGVFLWGGGETGLNFFVKGPDAWGAKTHAIIVADFTGVWGSGGFLAGNSTASSGINYNTLDLLVAEIGFDWANTSVTAGINGSWFGDLFTWTNQLAWGTINYGNKGAAPVAPQITVTERFDKNWSVGFGVMSNYNQIDYYNAPGYTVAATALNLAPGTANLNPLPMVEGKVAYSSDACGKVGPWSLLFEVDGAYGRVRNTYDYVPGVSLYTKDVPEWLADFKFLIPIIPERNGNKAGALYADAMVFLTQGMGQGGSWLGFGGGAPWVDGDYQRPADPTDWAAPVGWGFTAHADFYLSDAVSFNLFYDYFSVDASQYQMVANNGAFNGVNSGYQWIATLLYDVNPAVRLGWQWDYTNVRYPVPLPGFKGNGSTNDYRFSVYYFF
jgi:hypothetical protein